MSGTDAFVKDLHFAGSALWQVLLASLVLGAGLPVLFALGVRAHAWGTGVAAGEGTPARAGHRLGRPIAYLLFAVVLYILAIGIYFIVVGGHGKELAFNGLWPEQVAKK